ncbi:MAG: restriction endonuclease subunit S [Planctomycetota bacterium]
MGVDGWGTSPFGALFEIQLGKMLSPKARVSAEPKPYLRNVNVQWNRIDLDNLARMDFSADEREKFALRPGDLLVCEGGEVGRSAIWKGELEECYYQKALHRLRPRSGDVDPTYVLHYLTQKFRVEKAFAQEHGQTTIAHLPKERLERLPVLLPSLAEQRKIAAILSSVDETIETTEAVIAQIDVVKKAMLEELLTRGIPGRHSRFKQTEIGDVPTDWSVITLDACNDPSRPICYGILMPGKHCADGVPVIKVKNIKNGEVDASDLLLTAPEIDAQYRRSRLRAGDLLLTIRGTTGRVALVPDALASANITQDTARVSAGESTSSAFLYYALQSVNAQAQIRDHTRGQAVKGINIGDVRRLLLPLPPKGEQQTIVETVRAIDEGFRAESLALSALRATKNALAAVLLAGELRVTAEDAA